ncbi:unnamed protein product [Heligmosomoides polygyrus]|uniref:DUF7083 domain-containing protein n=1 Tax=Heligmosomoides polygyrus TaxID=6339 RepID=A0A183G924_HELPZ|nr:unnamed protein product [Heligmosomoides polygyrus]
MATMTDEQFQRLLTALATAVEGLARRHHPPQPTPHDPARQFDALAGRIAPFVYDPDADLTFESWYRRYDGIFNVDATGLDEPTRVRLLLYKLDAGSCERYSSYILPQNPKNVSFKQTLVKDPGDDFATYAGRVNRECAKFKLSECNKDQFKCLIFVFDLQSSDEAFIRLKLLDKIEADPNCTVQTLTEECKRPLNLRHDTRMIDGKPAVQAIKGQPESTPASASLYIPHRRQQSDHDHNRSRRSQRSNSHKTPPSPCWNCEALHFVRDCPFQNHICSKCHIMGQKDGFCSPPNRRTRTKSSMCRAKDRQSKGHERTQSSGYPILTATSDITVISHKTWSHMGKPRIEPSTLIAQCASEDRFISQANDNATTVSRAYPHQERSM